MKKYAVSVDVSPSEQIGDHEEQVFSLGALLGLNAPRSFDMVGENFPELEGRLRLRKFSGSSKKYRAALLVHLAAIRRTGHVVCGISVVNQRFIRRVGLPVWQKANGEVPAPSSLNNGGRPRVMLGGYSVDGQSRSQYEVLVDDLAILGWLALEIGLFHKMLCEINGSLVRLDVIIDRLPNEKGTGGTNKAELLKGTLTKLSDRTITVIGHPDVSDFHQRDLLADNLAGLGRSIFTERSSAYPETELEKAVGITRVNLPPDG